MPYPPPKTHTQTFEKGGNTDLADELMPNNMFRYMLNCRVVSSAGGNMGIVTNINGTVMIATPLPAGTCKTIGAAADEKNNKFYFAVWNSNGYHTWFLYDEILNRIIYFLQSITDSEGIDILNFDPDYPIFHIDIVIIRNIITGQDNTALYWCDALNKGRKVNIQKCLDKTSTGYGYQIFQEYINQYKTCPAYAPVLVYFTDLSTAPDGSLLHNANYLYAQLFKFCYRYIYDDGEISCYSDWSIVALPPNESYEGTGGITTDNNGIAVSINTGSLLVRKIEIAMLTTGTTTVNSVEVQGAQLEWVTIAILNKDELLIADNTIYVYNFYNDGSYPAADQTKIAKAFDFMFRVPVCQAFVKTAMTQTGGDEGFPPVTINVGVVNQPIPLFISPGTTNQLNNPSITISQLSYSTQTGGAFLFSTVRYNPVIQFIIGNDVKKGNKYTISGTNGGSDHYSFSYTATLADTAVSVANQIKAYLRGIGRGIPDGNNGISSESVSSGNASFVYSYLGKWKEQITKFTGTVNRVSYISLQNNGVSVQVIKSGSARQYGIGYEDDDGRKTNVYTNDTCSIRTPFLTEAPGGVLQQPVHQISVYHQPPVWARRWILYRTPDEVDFIQILIQKVIDVTVISGLDQGEYLDLVVGSLTTYQQIHPDVIISYQFTRGDRLRLIRNTTSGDYYTPFYETEVLSYSEVTTEQRNAQITTYGSDLVKPADGTIADYVGKNIQIAGIERTIIGLGTTSVSNDSHVLDSVINIGAVLATVIEPSYTFIDRRGIVRITKPPSTYTVVDFSTVELYTPVKNTNNLDFQLFNDTAQKFEVINFGTDIRSHAGSHQDQDGTNAGTLISTPAIILVTEGDAYIRDRELPTNTELENTEIIVDTVEDPNFSDFYISNLNNLGRIFPKDDGTGQKHFDSRTRFSNNYITDTAINGLNDFDDLDRVDNNDAFDAVMLTKFRGNKLYLFKRLRDAYLPVGRTIISTATGVEVIGLSDKLLGDIVYLDFEGGIGDNPESWFVNDNYMYHAMAAAGVFVRIAGDGVDSISKEFGFDYGARQLLAQVKKNGLRLQGGFDKPNGGCWWSMPSYIPPVFNNAIDQADWDTLESAVPAGSTVVIVTQPANGVVTYDGTNFNINMNSGFVGQDTFTYKFSLPGGGYSSIKNVCINSVSPPVSKVGYRPRYSSKYCILIPSSDPYVNAFSFPAVYNQPLSTLINSNIITVSGVAGIVPFPITITGGSYSINGGAFVNTPGSVNIGDTVQVQVMSSSSNGTTNSATLTILDQSSTFSETTIQPATATGILVVDIFSNTTINAYAYIDTPGVSPYHDPAYTGKNFTPNDGTAASDCYILSSDILAGPPTRRFEFNITKLMNLYPSVTEFVLKVAGRDVSAGTIGGSYVIYPASTAHMTMSGTPGTYIPSVDVSPISSTSYSGKATISGADGTYGMGIGADILIFTYNVAAQTITLA